MPFQVKNPDEIGVAFLGVGRMGMTHLQTLAGIRNARVVTVADPDIEAARNGQKVSLAERATTDALAAIDDPDVEAVVIVTPTSTHASLIEAALRAVGTPERAVDEARRLVVRGFFASIVARIGVPEISDHLMEVIDAELGAVPGIGAIEDVA